MAKSERAIALFSGYYPSHGGGIELACADLVRGLLAAGVKVKWVSQADGPLPHDLSGHCLPLPGTDLIYLLSGIPMPLPMPWALPTTVRATKRAGAIVVTEANFVLSVVAFITAKLLHKPILLVQHVGEPSTVSKFARLVMRFGEKVATRPMVRNADAVVCVSPVVARYFEGERTKSELQIIGHGIDTKSFRMSSGAEERSADREALGLNRDGKLACFVGRLTESKGISVIAEMAHLRPDWMFAVAGVGPVAPERWGLRNVVRLGRLDRIQVARLYRASDVLVLPSQSESFSLVVREALASGTTVICSDQILDTDPGLAPFVMTEPVNLHDISTTGSRFASALDRKASAPSEKARDYVVDQCSWATVVTRYVGLIEDLLSRQRGTRT